MSEPKTTTLAAGYTLTAENKVQELKDKFEKLKKIPQINHFIEHLQTNKTDIPT